MKAGSHRNRCAVGWQIASTISETSRSKTRPSSPTARSATCPEPGKILNRRSRLPWNTATRPSSSAMQSARWSLSAMCSGQCSMRFIMLMAANPISDATQPRIAKGVRLQLDPATGKTVLLFPEGIVELNETAQEILSRCDGRTLSEIVRDLAEEYDADVAALAADVRETLADLNERKLIELT